MELTTDLIRLNIDLSNKNDTIEYIGEILSSTERTKPQYTQGIKQREAQENTFLGKGVAIPHGIPETRKYINQTTIVVLQIPKGVPWGDDGELAQLVIGIAAKGDEHLNILKRLTRILSNESLLETLKQTQDPQMIIDQFVGSENIKNHSDDSNKKSKLSAHKDTFNFQQKVILPNPQGMHARPATQLAKLAQNFDEDIYIESPNHQIANARKMFEILSLGLTQKSEIRVMTNSQQGLNDVVHAIKKGLGDDLSVSKNIPNNKALWEPTDDSIKSFTGIAASNGLVIGRIKHQKSKIFIIPNAVKTPLLECHALDQAFKTAQSELTHLISEMTAQSELTHLISEMTAQSQTDKANIFNAHLALLDDQDIISESVSKIYQGENAAKAYLNVTDEKIKTLSSVADSNIAARAADILDIRNRVMDVLLNQSKITTDSAKKTQNKMPYIICTEDLTPSDTAKLDPDQILGFITAYGGPTSHSAIIAKGMGLPAIVGAKQAVDSLSDDTIVIMDGGSGMIYVSPNEDQLKSAELAQKKHQMTLQEALESRNQLCITSDGQAIQIAANVNDAKAAKKAIDSGAEGVGLMRTEFLYLERNHIPSESTQVSEYRAMAKVMGDKLLIIRTLDIGGDKEVPYLNLAREDNAFLGMRGIRLCFDRPDLFIPQLRAICETAKEYNNIHVMFPMIGQLSEWQRARSLLDEIRKEVGAPNFPVGMMIEVPSAALIAEQLAPHVDFFSIGTNDLTQYTLAMDRMHPALADQTDALHPAILKLIDQTVKAAKQHNKWVGVCGGAAGDIDSAKIFIGLGVTELSVGVGQIAPLKQAIRQYCLKDLNILAQKALKQPSAQAIRSLLAE